MLEENLVTLAKVVSCIDVVISPMCISRTPSVAYTLPLAVATAYRIVFSRQAPVVCQNMVHAGRDIPQSKKGVFVDKSGTRKYIA